MKILAVVLLTCGAILAASTEALTSSSLLSNEFSADIYKEFKVGGKGNFVICPLSIEILLALIYSGAKGNTAEELSKVLRLPQSKDAIEEKYRELHLKLQANDKYTLQSANKIYVQKDCSVKEEYKTKAVDVFGAAIQNIDFNQAPKAAAEINDWVDRNTRHKISQLVTERDITSDTRAILLNAIYFKGKWEAEFKKRNTKLESFFVTKESYVKVSMMEQTNEFRFYQSDDLKAKFIEIPYEGDDVTMTLVLPDSKEGLPTLEGRIHEVVVEPRYNWVRVNLKMPKSKIVQSVELNSILKELGIREAFTQKANFNQMLHGYGTTDQPLFISKVVQKALIETDEEGTIAAAVSGGVAATLSLPLPKPPPINFHANHPFIFFLKHKGAGILFIGRYSSPEGRIVTSEQSAEDKEEVYTFNY